MTIRAPVSLPTVTLLLAGASAVLTGCDQAVTVPARFPEPVIEALPLRMGIVYPAPFRDFAYKEDVGGEALWTIQLGAANTAVFDAVFRRLFQESRPLDAVPSGGDGLDGYIEPKVEAFEFALPSQSGTDVYSVWIRYTLNVYGPDGKLITAWQVNAYGQSGEITLRPARSMEQATRQALRDAAAAISIGFPAEPAIQDALLKKQKTDEPSASDATDEPIEEQSPEAAGPAP